MRRIAITGAAGNLGQRLRAHWRDRAGVDLVLLDRAPGGDPAVITADLSILDPVWIDRLAGVDAIVHLAAEAASDAPWPALIGPNVDAVLNLYDAAIAAKVKRVVLASSVWTMASQAGNSRPIGTGDPDPGGSAYGASKLFAERVALAHARGNGPDTVALRIGGCPPGENRPVRKDYWEDQCWLSGRDFCRGVEHALDARITGFVAVNLTSLVKGGRWDLSATKMAIGYEPLDRYDPPSPLSSGIKRALRRALWARTTKAGR